MRFYFGVVALGVLLVFALVPNVCSQTLTIRDGALFTPQDEAEMEQRLHDDIDSLSVDHVRGVYRTRHGRRVETFLEALPFLERRLINYISGIPGTFFFDKYSYPQDFERDCFFAQVSDTLSLGICNLKVVASLPSSRRGPIPHVILCSHYDSDGRLSGPGWHFESDPAPGADDAGSGCAAVLELLQQAESLDLPFEVDGIFFGGEEFGLLGSRHEAPLARERGDSILAVINLDQLAYASRLDSLFVVTNAASSWLADSLVSVSKRAWKDGPPLISVIQSRPSESSDHFPYLQQGYSAAMLVEAPEPLLYNKTTETVADTLGNLRMSAIRRAVELVSLWLRELAAPQLRPDAPDPRWVDVCPRFNNFPAVLPVSKTVSFPAASYRWLAGRPSGGIVRVEERIFTVAQRDPWFQCAEYRSPLTGRVIGRSAESGRLGPGSRVDVIDSLTYQLAPQDYGQRYLGRAWRYSAQGDTGSLEVGKQVGSIDFESLDVPKWDQGPYQSPIRLPGEYLEGVILRLDLPPLTPVEVRVVDATGRLVLSGERRVIPFTGNFLSAGSNQISLAGPQDQIRVGSGIYFYQLTLKDGRTSHGRFMVLK